MQTLVINLDRSTERFAHMAAQFSRLGVAYERLPGIDGSTLDAAYIARFNRMLPAQIGTVLSHRAAWQRLTDSGEPYAIVFEDDVHIDPSFAEFAGSTDWIPPDAGIVRFETAMWRVHVDDRPHNTWYGSAVRRMRSYQPGTAAYLISAEAARLLLARVQPHEPIDDAVFFVDEPWRTLPVVYQLDPAVCVQDMFIHSQPKDQRLASLVPPIARSPKPVRLVRQGRRICRRAKIAIDKAASLIGAHPRFTCKMIPLGNR